MAQTKMPIDALADLEENDFVDQLKDVYEKSPWVPRRLYSAKCPADFESTTNLAAAFKRVVQDASPQELRKLMNSYPDLAGRAHVEGKVTEESRDEHVSSLTVATLACPGSSFKSLHARSSSTLVLTFDSAMALRFGYAVSCRAGLVD